MKAFARLAAEIPFRQCKQRFARLLSK